MQGIRTYVGHGFSVVLITSLLSACTPADDSRAGPPDGSQSPIADANNEQPLDAAPVSTPDAATTNNDSSLPDQDGSLTEHDGSLIEQDGFPPSGDAAIPTPDAAPGQIIVRSMLSLSAMAALRVTGRMRT